LGAGAAEGEGHVGVWAGGEWQPRIEVKQNEKNSQQQNKNRVCCRFLRRRY
jgi:hypothetical protein